MIEEKYRIIITLEEFVLYSPFPSRKIRELKVPISSEENGIKAYTGLKNLIGILTKGLEAFDDEGNIING